MTNPIYIKIENKKAVQKELQIILNKTENAKNILNEIKSLKEHEEKLISEWETRIDNAQRNLGKVSDMMEDK